MQLLVAIPAAPDELAAELLEPSAHSEAVQHAQGGIDAESAQEFILEIGVADVESESGEVRRPVDPDAVVA